MRRPILVIAVLVPVLLVTGIWLGGHPSVLPDFARDRLVDDGDAQVYEQAVDIINRDYYRGVSRDQLLNKSLGAAVKSLDDQFSNYFSPKDYTNFQEVTQGQFSGVGMTVEEAKHGLRVMTVYKGSPASKAGLKSGDLVTAVNGRSIAGDSSEASTARIKGPAGTPVTLTVKSGGQEREVKLKRAQVDIPVVESSMERKGSRKVGHVRLAGFTSGAHGEVSQAVHKLLRQGADGIVLDLRDNGGGLLNEAVLICSIFIPEGKIVSTKGRSRPERVYEATGGAIPGSVPVAVLVNRQSASASEIVTGALQDRKRATVVGTRTFGKGVFQEIEQLSNGGAGVAKGKGIAPDVKALDDPKTRPDEALDEAVGIVLRDGT